MNFEESDHFIFFAGRKTLNFYLNWNFAHS